MMSTVGSARCARLPRLWDSTASLLKPWGVQQLSWRAVAIHQNVSNCRRELLNPSTWNDDAVTAAVSFLSDTQESSAVVLPELDVEMLAFNLQFFRLDDVVHFALRPPSLGSRLVKWKKNPCPLREFLVGSLLSKSAVIDPREDSEGDTGKVAVQPAQSRLWCLYICTI
jgi:hypothetical protein